MLQADWFVKHRQRRPAVAVLFLSRHATKLLITSYLIVSVAALLSVTNWPKPAETQWWGILQAGYAAHSRQTLSKGPHEPGMLVLSSLWYRMQAAQISQMNVLCSFANRQALIEGDDACRTTDESV